MLSKIFWVRKSSTLPALYRDVLDEIIGKEAIRRDPLTRIRPLPRLLCPICKSSARSHRTDDATGYTCPMHGNFKVADTIVPDDYTRQQWEAALKKAELRTEQGEWPLVRHGDFGR